MADKDLVIVEDVADGVRRLSCRHMLVRTSII